MSKTFAEQVGNRCKHFTGLWQHGHCKAGIPYASVRDESKRPYGLPCLRDTNPCTTCDRAEFPTAEDVAAEEAALARTIANINTARGAIVAQTDGKRGVRGSVSCPVCHSGTLSYSVSGYNGHIHAQCSDEKCVRWME